MCHKIREFLQEDKQYFVNCKDSEIMKERVERLLENIGNLTFSRAGLKVQCSVGITLKHEDDTIHSIFKRADTALYQAKNDGKGKYRIIV